MITLNKIVRFETAHAIYQYPGKCAQLHGHSYELHVTVASEFQAEKPPFEYLDELGIAMDFKELKNIIQEHVLSNLDHKILLSEAYLRMNTQFYEKMEVIVFSVEPTAENILIYISNKLQIALPNGVHLISMKLWETEDSYAEWHPYTLKEKLEMYRSEFEGGKMESISLL